MAVKSETQNGAEVLSFDDLETLAGGFTSTRGSGIRQGDLADYIGEVVTIVGLHTSTRKGGRVTVELQAADGIPTRVRAPQTVINGLQRAYSQRPNAHFRVYVQDKGKGSSKRHASLTAAK
jgi:hypothetical protein